MSNSAQNLCLPLPNAITNSFTSYESREQFVVKHLEKLLPSSDSKEVLEELKRTFLLGKHKNVRKSKETDKFKRKSYLKRKNANLKRIGKNHDILYKDLLPLNEMWLDYVKQNLGGKDFKDLPCNPIDSRWETINRRLLKADFHGALVSVVRSKNPSIVGTLGIILQETKNCFNVLTPDNRLKVLPKDSSVFKFHLPNANFEVYGSEICFKPAERSVKKFKACHLGEL